MTALEVKVEKDGVLKLPSGVSLPRDVRLAVLAFSSADQQDWNSASIFTLAEQSGTLDFLKEEPEIYSDRDILPGRENPRFRR